jgi:NAD(P)-dependent dehydrogenase (short-subunit alcohol dehydrogenase family)
VRRQFETNVFGLVRMTQLVLPAMRRQGWGRIINVSSMGGKLVFPGGGFYHSTKWAVEAISDALRFEVQPFGVDVAVIEPGAIATGYEDTSRASMDGLDPNSPYAAFNKQRIERVAATYKGNVAGPEIVATRIEHAINAKRPRTRYPITTQARGLLFMRRLLPDRAWDALMRTQFKTPKP